MKFAFRAIQRTWSATRSVCAPSFSKSGGEVSGNLVFLDTLLKVHTQGVNHVKFAMCAILAAGSFAFVAESEEKDKRGCIYYAETSMDTYLMNCLI